jgi:plastocyanin
VSEEATSTVAVTDERSASTSSIGGPMPTDDRSRPRALPFWALALVVPVVAALAVVVTLTATDDDTDATAAAPAGAATGDAVTIENFAYSPARLQVAVGTEVTVMNADGAPHTLTADDGSFDTGDLDGGATATISIRSPGRYGYFCDIHNYMTGVIEAR